MCPTLCTSLGTVKSHPASAPPSPPPPRAPYTLASPKESLDFTQASLKLRFTAWSFLSGSHCFLKSCLQLVRPLTCLMLGAHAGLCLLPLAGAAGCHFLRVKDFTRLHIAECSLMEHCKLLLHRFVQQCPAPSSCIIFGLSHAARHPVVQPMQWYGAKCG